MVDMFSLKERYKPSVATKPEPKSAASSFDYTLLPKKIIKATKSYSAQHQNELSFEKGDFFHVVGRENDCHWYAVNNPLSNLNGLVPVSYFQVVDNSTRTMTAIQPILPLDHHHKQLAENQYGTATRRSSIRQQPHPRCYGIVLYDFVAERQDELGCKADETIIVIAQSNKEWYVAKPIGRLGGPGLIPVSFVQLYDLITNYPVLLPTTGRQSLSDSPRTSSPFTIPNLDEWKKQTQIYETSTIPLSSPGVHYSVAVDPFQPSKNISSVKHDRHSGGGTSLMSNLTSLSDHQQHQQWYPLSSRQQNQRHRSASSSFTISSSSSSSSSSSQQQQQQQRQSYESSGSSTRYSNELTHKKTHHPILKHSQVQPSYVRRTSIYNPSASQHTKVIDITANSFIMEGSQYWFVFYATVNNGKHRILYRSYDYFYQFHVRLLQEYPKEAGKGDQERILPLLPAPLAKVDDLITEQRREDLDDYCKQLLALPSYLSGSDLIQNYLLGLKEGDVETDYALKKGGRAIKSTCNTTYPEQSIVATTQQQQHNAHQYQQQRPNENRTSNINDVTTHGTDTTPYGGTAGLVKIKIIYKDDIFAVKISADCTMQELRQRIKDRIGGDSLGSMKYKHDTPQYKQSYLPLDTELDMEEAFILALQHGKLTIVVDT